MCWNGLKNEDSRNTEFGVTAQHAHIQRSAHLVLVWNVRFFSGIPVPTVAPYEHRVETSECISTLMDSWCNGFPLKS